MEILLDLGRNKVPFAFGI